jgi:hypothetical protein
MGMHTYWAMSTISLIIYGFAEAFRSYSEFTGAGSDALLVAYPFFGASYHHGRRYAVVHQVL